MGKVESVRYYFDCLTPYFVYFATRALYNMFTLQHVHFVLYNVHSTIRIEQSYKSAGWIS